MVNMIVIRSLLKARSVMVWLGLSIYLLFTLCCTPNMVLCQETDGRTSLEATVAGVCNELWQSEEQIQAEHTSHQTISCARCRDIPLNLSSTEFKPYKINPAHDYLAQDIAWVEDYNILSPYLTTITISIFPHPPPFAPSIHQLLDTVILLV